jgi:TolA-binding protein
MNADIHTVFSAGDCPPYEQLLAFSRGELSGEEKNRIEHHLAECAMCTDELGGLSKMKDVSKLPEIVAGIQSEIKDKQRKIIPLNRRFIFVSAAATVIILLGVLFLFRLLPSRQPEKTVAHNMEKLFSPAPSQVSSPPEASSVRKPLLAVVQHPEKKEVIKEEEKNVPVVEQEVIADEKPKEVVKAAETEASGIIKQDSAVQARDVGIAATTVAGNADEKTVVKTPVASQEARKNSGYSFIMKDGSASFDSAMMLYRKGIYAQASILFVKKLETDPANSAGRYYLADCWYRLKEYTKARRELEKLLSDPKDPYYQRGSELLKKVKGEE